MIFYVEKGQPSYIWDPKNERVMVHFVDGKFETTDKKIIKILQEKGYKSEKTQKEIADERIELEQDIRAKLLEEMKNQKKNKGE